MRFSITSRDIECGIAGDCERCPAALAIQRRMPGKWVWVDSGTIEIGDSRYPTPLQVQEFIDLFDQAEDFDCVPHPTTFELPVPDHEAEE